MPEILTLSPWTYDAGCGEGEGRGAGAGEGRSQRRPQHDPRARPEQVRTCACITSSPKEHRCWLAPAVDLRFQTPRAPQCYHPLSFPALQVARSTVCSRGMPPAQSVGVGAIPECINLVHCAFVMSCIIWRFFRLKSAQFGAHLVKQLVCCVQHGGGLERAAEAEAPARRWC